MCYVVVDPQILVRAFEIRNGPQAKLLALLVYGRTCAAAHGVRIDEVNELDDLAESKRLDGAQLARLREWAERARDVALERKKLLDAAFEQMPPDDLRLVVSNSLLDELTTESQRAQGAGRSHVQPDKVKMQITRCVMKHIPELGPAPRYLGPDLLYRREYLIHTAIVGEAESLITEDKLLLLPGGLAHSDPTTRGTVRPYSLEEFKQDRLCGNNFSFDDINASAVLRAANHYLGPE